MPRTKGSSNSSFGERYAEDLERGRKLAESVDTDPADDTGEEMPEIKPQERQMQLDAGDTFEVEDRGEDQGGYYCKNCGYENVPRGTPSCPKCGAALDWSQVE